MRPPLDILSPNLPGPCAARTSQAAAACVGMTAEEQAMPLVDFVNLKVPSSEEPIPGPLVTWMLLLAGAYRCCRARPAGPFRMLHCTMLSAWTFT